MEEGSDFVWIVVHSSDGGNLPLTCESGYPYQRDRVNPCGSPRSFPLGKGTSLRTLCWKGGWTVYDT